ncbi:MAG: hypothetical protein A2X90_00220 [Deltaproteobacteria bacterium GWA2_65_63]|nr:MAG: hypothetical protein A2X90_00220 [Deltaproteobacteria bacterium GWA2_65_63]
MIHDGRVNAADDDIDTGEIVVNVFHQPETDDPVPGKDLKSDDIRINILDVLRGDGDAPLRFVIIQEQGRYAMPIIFQE